jgi:hypothetical protein
MVDHGLRKTEYENFKEWNDIFSQRIKPDLLIQGSSRAKVQYSTVVMDSLLKTDSYNMGMNGSPFDVQYTRFKACIMNGIIPKVIIQNVDYETITRNSPPYQPYFFLPYINNREFKKQVANQNLLPAYKRSVFFLKYAGELKAILTGLIEFCHLHHFRSVKHKGYEGNNMKWNGANFERRKRQPIMAFTVDKDVDVLFNDFLKECKQYNIKVIMAYSPPYYELNDYLETEKIFDYYHAIAKKYDIPFLNYSCDSISFDKTNYYNATHMNQRGAELFSKKVCYHIDSLNLLK